MAPAQKKVWVRDPKIADTDVFVLGSIISTSGTQVTVATPSGTQVWEQGNVYDSNSSDGHVKDHCNLEVLNSATLVENTRVRFKSDIIYTYVSEILIAVNPFKFIEGMYTDERKAIYKGVNWTTVEPHVYAAAEMAFKHMELQGQSQSLLVSGESGAGKTETNKQLMDYLIWRAGTDRSAKSGASKNLAQQILDTNPVLEAFGNAKNSRNKNSSRFGKYVNLKFNRELQIMGAEVRTFLLEKSRVTNTVLAGERSYHIFYQLVSGSQGGKMGEPQLKGKTADDFSYTSMSGTSKVEGVDDAVDFAEVDRGLETCNFSEIDRNSLYQVLAAMLFIGNVKLNAKGDDTVEVSPDCTAFLKSAETLLGIGDLSALLVEKVVHSPRSKSEYHIALDLSSAINQRDALVKHIYSMTFNLLIARINLNIETDKDFHKFIGLLDVFGFEVFQTNSFEQLCINYANERLHNFFLMRVFEVEIELYRMQALQVPAITYPDNAKVIELLEKATTGIFPLLDAQCKMPKGSDKGFCQMAAKTHSGTNPHFSTLSASKMKMKGVSDDNAFVISHFAGDVCYTCTNFLEKNVDQLSAQFETELNKSAQPLVVQMMAHNAGKPILSLVGGGTTPRLQRRDSNKGGESARKPKESARGKGGDDKKGGSGSVSKKFLLSLKQLMREIATTHPYFVRCIKPNAALKPVEFNVAMVLGQLEKSGTIECVKLMQEGYPSRAPYEDLLNRFRNALPEFMLTMVPQQFVQLLLLACNCQPGDYQLGQDMVFFRANKGGVLQELMMMRKDDVAQRIVDNADTSDAGMALYVQKLSQFVEERKRERKEAMALFTGGMLAAIKVLQWITWGEKEVVLQDRSATKLQAMRRGRQARVLVKEKRKKAREKEQARLAAVAAAKAAEEAAKAAEEAAGADAKAAQEAAKAAQEAAKKAAEEADAAAAEVDRAEAAERDAAELAASVAKVDLDGATSADAVELLEDEEHDDEFDDKWFVKLKGVEFHRYLMCKGVEWGFQYHNFYGDWEMAESEPIFHDRPHYVHNTMYGGYAHLFHTIDPHYNVPRWVIGPAPGNENGWAFCESDSETPHEVLTTWISWDGFEWHSCKTFRFVPKEHELDGLTDEEDFEEEEEDYYMEPDVLDDGGGANVVAMSAQEYEQQLTARQNALDPKPDLALKAVAQEQLVTPSPPASSRRDGDSSKKEKKKKSGGGLFSKKKK